MQTFKFWFTLIAGIITTIMVACALFIQFYFLNHSNEYKDQVATYIAKAIQQPVSIERLDASWHGITPEVSIQHLEILDKNKRPALSLPTVHARISWSSIFVLAPYLAELSIDSPSLHIRRSSSGEVFLAGISLNGPSNPVFANWLINQRRIKVRHATVQWADEFRAAPILALNDFNIEINTPTWRRLLGRHQFSLDTLVSAGTKERINVNGVLVGRDVSQLKTWKGTVELNLPSTDLAAWKPWVDTPFRVEQGEGNLTASLLFSQQKINQVDARLNIQDLHITLPQQTKSLIARKIQGKVSWSALEAGQKLALNKVNVDFSEGFSMTEASGNLAWQVDGKNQTHLISSQGNMKIAQFKLSQLNLLTESDLLPAEIVAKLNISRPSGQLSDIELDWETQHNQLKNYQLEADFKQLTIDAFALDSGAWSPGIKNWAGHISANPKQGKLKLDTQQATLDLANILRKPTPITRLTGKLNWEKRSDGLLLSANNLQLRNPHLNTVVDFKLKQPKQGDATIDLKGEIVQGNAKYASFYYPISLGETTLHWLDTSILGGEISQGEVILKGKLKDFPYTNAHHLADPKLGTFKVTALLKNATLEYGTGWPFITSLDTRMTFHGKHMDLEVLKGTTVNNQIVQAHVEIPQLDADWPMLNIKSLVKGNVKDGVQFVNTSPVKDIALGFTEHIRAQGEGLLKLDLQIPLENHEAAHFQGDYTIQSGILKGDQHLALPEIKKINGHLLFNEKGLQAPNVKLEMFNNPAVLHLKTLKDKTILIQSSGRINDASLKKMNSNLLTQAMHGTTDWKANISIKKPLMEVDMQSQLVGMAIQLPAPFGKPAEKPSNFNLKLRQPNPETEHIEAHYEDWIEAKLIRTAQNDVKTISAGDIAINTRITVPSQKGIKVSASFPRVDVDAWTESLQSTNSTQAKTAWASQLEGIDSIILNTPQLNLFGRQLNDLKLVVHPNTQGLKLDIESKEIAGDAYWIEGKQDKILAKLNYLRLPKNKQEVGVTKPPEKPAEKQEIRRQTYAYPELDIEAQSLEIGELALGQLELKAYANEDDWHIQKLNIKNPDSQLTADGTWQNSLRSPNTALKFNLSSNNIGNTLKRFGHPDMVKGGTTNMQGHLAWPGSPHEFAIERLGGEFKFNAEKGQIVKLQPGVGRLLGLVSLQSLPRRLTLDFKDLFSEGYAFDSITASAKINDGILRSQDFFMTGPAAEAKIKGETNLKAETQNLRVTVIPHVTDSLSLAAFAGGPIAGVAAFVAQKLLKDPFNQVTSTDYVITGSWDNPQEIEQKKQTEPTAKQQGITN